MFRVTRDMQYYLLNDGVLTRFVYSVYGGNTYRQFVSNYFHHMNYLESYLLYFFVTIENIIFLHIQEYLTNIKEIICLYYDKYKTIAITKKKHQNAPFSLRT